MIVRPAHEADLAALEALEVEAFPLDPWGRSYLAEAIAGTLPTVSVVVAVDDAEGSPEDRPGGGPVIGHAIVSTVFEVAELQRIAVTSARRRTGVASALLSYVVRAAAREGAVRLLLEVREENGPARAFYARAGFAEIDRRQRYYGDGATAVILQLPLPHEG